MKKLLMIILASSFFSIGGYTQNIKADKVPADVMTAFQKMFPKAEKVEWEMDKNTYEASFKSEGKEFSVLFDNTGNYLESEIEIPVKDLPQAVIESLKKAFPGSEIDEAEKVTLNDNSVVYEAEVELNKKSWDVRLAPDGKILSQEEDEDQDDD
jgi:hypothetical protein